MHGHYPNTRIHNFMLYDGRFIGPHCILWGINIACILEKRHWEVLIRAVYWKMSFSNSPCRSISWTLRVQLISWKYHRALLVITQHSGNGLVPSDNKPLPESMLTHWGRDKMDAISQTTYSSAFSWMKMFEFRLKFHWRMFLRVQLTIIHQWWLVHWRMYASLGLNELTQIFVAICHH